MKRKVLAIGSGLAGTLICNELDKSCDVTLIEKGAQNAIASPPVYFLKKHFGAVKTFWLGHGGTTNLWDNGLIPISTEDVAGQDFAGLRANCAEYQDGAASHLYFGKKRYTVEYGTVLSTTRSLAESIGVFKDGVDCLIYPKRYSGLRASVGVHTLFGVERIDFESANGHIKKVSCQVGEARHEFYPDDVVVCGGALGSPRIVADILASQGNPSDHAGIGLADHPMGFVGKLKVKPEFADKIQRMAYCDRGDYVFRTAVRIKSDCGQYTACAFFRPALSMQNRLSIYKYKSLIGAGRGMQRVRAAMSIKLFHPDILAEIFSHLTGIQVRSGIFNILVLFEQKRGTNRVSYDGQNILVDWRVSDRELELYNRMLKKLHTMLQPIAEELVIQIPITEDWLWSAAHHSGTIGLGPAPDGLVDATLKLHGFDNVHVCDGSVIQEHSYANTGLTIGQMAMFVAQHLKQN
jgi:hypothetical protein